MTNGEKIKEIFPNIIKYGSILIDDTGALQKNILFDDSWWNAEYKEPITENCIACKYDETEEEDGEHCKKCLAGDSQFELDKEFVDSTTKNDIRDNRVKDELNRVKNELEPTTNNDLEVDCISRKRVLEWLENATDDSIEHAIDSNLEFIPSVTPQNQVYPLCEDCHTKMDEVRRSYDNAMKQEHILDKLKADIENEIRFWQEPSKYGNADKRVRVAKVCSYKHILELIDNLLSEQSEG